jgi:hypothetical protein
VSEVRGGGLAVGAVNHRLKWHLLSTAISDEGIGTVLQNFHPDIYS